MPRFLSRLYSILLRLTLPANNAPDPHLKKTVKTLPHRGARHVDIHQRDLIPQPASSSPEAADNVEQNYGTEESNVAGVKLPFRIWLEGLATGGYESIVVLSEGFGASRGKEKGEDRETAVEATGRVGEGKGKGKGKEAKVDEKVKEKAEVRTKLGSLDVGEGGWKA